MFSVAGVVLSRPHGPALKGRRPICCPSGGRCMMPVYDWRIYNVLVLLGVVARSPLLVGRRKPGRRSTSFYVRVTLHGEEVLRCPEPTGLELVSCVTGGWIVWLCGSKYRCGDSSRGSNARSRLARCLSEGLFMVSWRGIPRPSRARKCCLIFRYPFPMKNVFPFIGFDPRRI